MAVIHLVLQGKGGVGKSIVASMLYQHFRESGYVVYGYDTDPVNQTLGSYKEFEHIEKIDILDDSNNQIDSRKFDLLLEKLLNAPEDSHIIIDNGASSFIALGAYIRDNGMIEILEENGHRVYLHTVITGGQALNDTLLGFVSLAKNFPQAEIITWLNPYFGKIGTDQHANFYELTAYRDFGNKIKSVIELVIGDKQLLGRDLEQLFAQKKSFNAGINGSNFVAVKHRLKKFWNEMKNRIDAANIL